ncbi:hypothetical protein ACFE04_025346 [Oxalis oulophora]
MDKRKKLCMCCDKSKVKKGRWSRQEDSILVTHIETHGHQKWTLVPKFAGLERCGKSCRLRWINYLRPNLKRGNFTKKEEETIINLKSSWGNKWSKIAAKLPGRTANEIKNLWNNHLKKRLPQSHKTNIHKKQTQENSSTSASKAFSSTASASTNLINSPITISVQSAVGNNIPEEVSNKPNDQIVSIEKFNMEGIHGVNNKQEEVKNIVNDDKIVKNDDNAIFKTYDLSVYDFEMGWSFSELEPIEENFWLEDHERTLGSL